MPTSVLLLKQRSTLRIWARMSSPLDHHRLHNFRNRIACATSRRPKPGWADRIPRSADDFKQAYLQSQAYQDALASIEEFEGETEAQAEEREASRTKSEKKNYTIPYYHQVLVLTQRQFLVMVGDKQSLFGKWSVVLFLALIVGSLFYELASTA